MSLNDIMATIIVTCWILSGIMSIVGIFLFFYLKDKITHNSSLIRIANCRLDSLIYKREDDKAMLLKERKLIIENQNLALKDLEDARDEVKFFSNKIAEMNAMFKEGVSASEAEEYSEDLDMYKEDLHEAEADCKKYKHEFSHWSRILQLVDDRLSNL